MAKDTDHPYKVGQPYFIRTVTHHYTGILREVYEHELVLVDAAWIADDGRFNVAVSVAEFNEIEPYPDGKEVVVGRHAIVDACVVPKVPRDIK